MRMLQTAALIALLTSSAASAQTVYHWPAPSTPTELSQRMYFPMGTPLSLTTRTQVSTKDSKPGDRLYLDVAESVSFHSQVVIPAGAVAVAEVVRADHNGYFGKKGKLDIKLLYVETPWGPTRIDGQSAKEGKSGTVASVATIVLVSPLGFLIHGTSATVPFGTTVKAYLAEPLAFAAAPPSTAVAVNYVQPDSTGRFPAAPAQSASR